MTNFDTLPAAYVGLEPRELWRHFAALNAIPRPSAQESAARDYVQKIADEAGATSQIDSAGNIVVFVAPRAGNANIEYSKSGNASAKTSITQNESKQNESENTQNGIVVAIQSHLDMVCEKRPDVSQDFAVDAIVPRRDGDRIFATGTTLGADNGIGAAAALALLTTPNLTHGALELIFTVEEETGLYGAKNLDSSRLRSTMMINLDSEDPDELTIGCAGGAGTTLHLPLQTQSIAESAFANWRPFELVVSGLKGGHSGVQIHEKLANAIKILTQVLRTVTTQNSTNSAPRLFAISGGSAHNAIPRDASAKFFIAPETLQFVEDSVQKLQETLRNQWETDEPDFHLELREIEYSKRAISVVENANSVSENAEIAQHELAQNFESANDESANAKNVKLDDANREIEYSKSETLRVLMPETQKKLLGLLEKLPHGVLAMSEKFPGKVQTSSNLSGVEMRDSEIEIATSTRSFVEAELQSWQTKIAEIGAKFGARTEVRDGYPGWEPDADSHLLEVAREVYTQVYGKTPQVEVVHAGLECGVILSHAPQMQAISFGPMIRGAHTPEENVVISTVAPTWNLLTTLLARLQ